MKIILILILIFSSSILWSEDLNNQNWIYQLKEKKILGITLAKYIDNNKQEHFKVGFHEGEKAFEKESVTKSEFNYLSEYGARITKDLRLFSENSNCSNNLEVTKNYSTKICYAIADENKKEFLEWHEHVKKFTLGKEEKENIILKRHLKKAP